MGFLDEFKRLAHPYEDEEEEEYDDFDESPRPVERRERERSTRSEPVYSSPASDELEARRSNKVVNIRAATQLQVVLVKPERFENASEIADHLREKRTVVLNLESTNKEIARRLLDFLSGVAYANEGQDQKGGHLHLYHHAVQRGYPRRPDRRAGEQRAVLLNRRPGGCVRPNGKIRRLCVLRR